MARIGDPFRTTHLDQLRARQRRHLRMMDPAFVARAVGGTAPPALGEVAEPQWLESELRELAELEMMHLEEILRRMEEANGRRMVVSFLREHASADPERALESLADELAIESSRGGMDGLAPRERMAVHRYFRLIVWADALADGDDAG